MIFYHRCSEKKRSSRRTSSTIKKKKKKKLSKTCACILYKYIYIYLVCVCVVASDRGCFVMGTDREYLKTFFPKILNARVRSFSQTQKRKKMYISTHHATIILFFHGWLWIDDSQRALRTRPLSDGARDFPTGVSETVFL